MLSKLQLKRTVGPENNTDLEDVLNTKTALRNLGYMETPNYGLTPYPDEPMFSGVIAPSKENTDFAKMQ